MKKFKDFISRFGFNTTPFTCEIRVEDHFVTEALGTGKSYREAVEFYFS